MNRITTTNGTGCHRFRVVAFSLAMALATGAPHAFAQTTDLIIQAEDYDNYFDNDASNNGGVYGSDGVDIEATTDTNGGYNVGWIQAGEWLSYQINLPAGQYEVKTRVASAVGGGQYTLTLDGVTIATDSVAATGSWQTWQTHAVGTINVTGSGSHTLRMNANVGDFNFNWIRVVGDAAPADGDSDGVPDSVDQCPGTPSGAAVDSNGCEVQAPSEVRVQAEDYTNYSDVDATNNGGAYRSDSVDIEASTDTGGGYNIGWTAVGEWLEYSVALEEGQYQVSTRVASDVGGGAYAVTANGASVGSDTVGATGGWQSWETHNLGTVTATSSGNQTVRVNISGGNFNFNWLQFTPVNDPDDGVQRSFVTPTPTVPDTLMAVDYDLGGAGVAYNDTSPGNTLGIYRNDDVDIEASTIGGYNVGWIETGDWLEYTINVSEADTYHIRARVASLGTGGSMRFEFSGATSVHSPSLVFGGTGGWQTWMTTGSVPVQLNAGQHVVRVVMETGGFNFHDVTIDNSDVPPPPGPVVSYPGYTGQYSNFTLSVDERFDGSTLNSATWRSGDGTFPENNCRFQPQGARALGGNLELIVRNEHVPSSFSVDQNQIKDARDYSCGELRMQNKIHYGRIEGRFRTPTSGATGFITSLFTYDNADHEWRELDIELEGGRPGSMSSNFIFGNNADEWFYEWQATRTWGAWEALHPTPRPTSQWIVYAMEWTPDYVAWFMDGVEVRRLTNNDVDGNPMVPPQIAPAWIPRKPTTVMMNFWIPTPAVMHGFGGDTGGNVYPMVAQYDWFRYYTWTPGTP